MAVCFPVCIFLCGDVWSWDLARSLVPASRRAQNESAAATMTVGYVFFLYIWMTVGVSFLFSSRFWEVRGGRGGSRDERRRPICVPPASTMFGWGGGPFGKSHEGEVRMEGNMEMSMG
ncbi:hypothetical protein LY76DRAFT_60520 [Colletotrichum caudatum]|nr:hypothetical protein LY76DRAFT_60520 [Colletotrichum caudatum]